MARHQATIEWERNGPDFAKGKYSREHTWRFDGGVVVAASSSPSVVPVPWSNPANVDPEEAFVASIASCHMLTFLFVAARGGFEIDRYRDTAVGEMTKGANGVPWVSSVTLAPEIAYRGPAPDAAREAEFHDQAHHQCFIANSVKTEVRVVAPGPKT